MKNIKTTDNINNNIESPENNKCSVKQKLDKLKSEPHFQKDCTARRKRSSKLIMYLTAVVFTVILGTLILVSALSLLVFEFDIFEIDIKEIKTDTILIVFVVGCLIIGCSIAAFLNKLIIRHIQDVSNAFEELANGNFDIRVPTNQKLSQIREMSQNFNKMANELSKIETLRKDFVMNVSHEFKTPLSAINGYATLLQNPNLPKDKHDRYLDIILHNSTRLSELSSNILYLSKLESQENIIMDDDIRLDEQIREHVLLLEKKWEKKNLEFDIDMPRIVYHGNEGLLGQVWSNLIDNAIKHSYDFGTIEIKMTQDDSYIYISFIDHGEGMSDEVKEHIFEKFYQADGSRKSEGNGLGLPLVKKIVSLSGGSLYVESEEGKGASFTVALPQKDKI